MDRYCVGLYGESPATHLLLLHLASAKQDAFQTAHLNSIQDPVCLTVGVKADAIMYSHKYYPKRIRAVVS